MLLGELLEQLSTSDVLLDVDQDDRLVVDAPTPMLDDHAFRSAIARHRDLLVASVVGRRTGHLVGICTHCGSGSLTHYRPASKFPACRMTPRCVGRHEPRADHVAQLVELDAPRRPTIPKPRKVEQPVTYPRTFRKKSGHVVVLLGPWPPWPESGPPVE